MRIFNKNGDGRGWGVHYDIVIPELPGDSISVAVLSYNYVLFLFYSCEYLFVLQAFQFVVQGFRLPLESFTSA